jgi:hypothetical protein
MNCPVTSLRITDYIVIFDNPIAAIFRNDSSCFAGSRTSLASCEPHSRETSNQLMELKERALSHVSQSGQVPGRYRPPDSLLAFLEGL